MATLYACDATGKTVKNKADLIEIGVRGRLYCSDIARTMEQYVADVDELHDEAAAVFREGLKKLRDDYRKLIGEDGKLPDE